MLKVELHAHTSDDPCDYIPHSGTELIDRAVELGYGAVAITLHDQQLNVPELVDHARRRGLILIPGVERAIERKHVLLINFPAEAERIESFEELDALKRRCNGLVVAPHPFYPTGSCLGSLLDRHADVFDAVELNAMYTRGLNFNVRATEWAHRYQKPLVGNADVHRLAQLGPTYSLVDADSSAGADGVCEAIRAGKVTVQTQPLSWVRAAWFMAQIVFRF